MGQKVNCNPVKLTSIVSYLQKSRVAHSIKDLEKHLPSVASINGMQVKDYLQSLSDDNKLHVEKIGSGNWYWSFASEDKQQRENALAAAEAAYEKAATIVQDLKQKVAEAQAQRNEDGASDDDRAELMVRKEALETRVCTLQKELAAYADNDPTELGRRAKEVEVLKAQTEQFTDEIYSMEGWFKKMGQDEDGLRALRMGLYGEEYDDEEGILKDI